MNFYEFHFSQYLQSINQFNLHKYNEKIYDIFHKYPQNMILYGPPGIGKYSQAIKFISLFSQSNLKYEKKMSINYEKNEFIFRLSDVHIDIDLNNLGCNSKLVWNEFFTNVLNFISINKTHFFIICKNFHTIHNELHDVFYSFMQTIPNIKYKVYFILITSNISFLNPNILSSSYIINLQRPTKNSYSYFHNIKNIDINTITSIKSLKSNTNISTDSFLKCLFNQIIKNNNNFFDIRNMLYDILIYNINIDICIWYIFKQFFILHENKTYSFDLTLIIYNFYSQFNNNYRPIYHLERLFINLINEHQKIMLNP